MLNCKQGRLLNIDIIARDPSFVDVSLRLQYLVPDEQPTPSVGDDPESSSGSTMVAALIILPLLGLVGWLLMQFRKPPQEPLQQVESSGGLLARAEKMNNS